MSQPLEDEYANVDAAVADVVVVRRDGSGTTYHRGDVDEPDRPACRFGATDRAYHAVSADSVVPDRRACRWCWSALVEEAAEEESSEVVRRDGVADCGDVTVATADGGGGGGPQLVAPTARLVLGRGLRPTAHAPVSSRESLCGQLKDGRLVEHETGGPYEPCGLCFDTDSVTLEE